jgi:hypothetical protein
MPTARTNACCAPLRWSSRRASPEPILIGRPAVVEVRLKRYGLRIRPGVDFELINPETTRATAPTVDLLTELERPRGVTQSRGAHHGAHRFRPSSPPSPSSAAMRTP